MSSFSRICSSVAISASRCEPIFHDVAHAIAPRSLPSDLQALVAGDSGPIVDELRRFRFHYVRWNSKRRREFSVFVVNREVRWNSCPARNLLTFFLFLIFYLDRIFSLTTTYSICAVRRNSGGFRRMYGGIFGRALPPFPLTVPCTALVDCRSVHRLSGGNGPRRHRLFESRNCADNQFHRNSLAVHFRNHVCNRCLQAAIPMASM